MQLNASAWSENITTSQEEESLFPYPYTGKYHVTLWPGTELHNHENKEIKTQSIEAKMTITMKMKKKK